MDKYFGDEHLHFLETPDGDFICIDIQRIAGYVFNVGWYTLKSRQYGKTEFKVDLSKVA